MKTFYSNLIIKGIKNIRNRIIEKKNGEWTCLVMDLTNYCNLRCPFCYNNWSKKAHPLAMNKETFLKVIEILPLIKKDIYLSCNYELTLHPKFSEYINLIPSQHRHKCFFTTNLSTKLSVNQIEDLSKSGLGFINISLDSFNPDVYELFRKGAKFKEFISNLNTMVSVFKENKKAPLIRFITMVFQQNIDEIPDIVEKCKTLYSASVHELRDSDMLLGNDWPTQNKISDNDWINLINKLKHYNHVVILRNSSKKTKTLFKIIRKFNLHSKIFINSDGTGSCTSNASFDINNIIDPYKHFKSVR